MIKTYKKLSTIFLFIMIISFSGCSIANKNNASNIKKSTTTTTKSGFINYSNYDSGFKLTYPETYQKQEGTMGTAVLLLSPKESPSDLFQENFNVAVQDLSSQPMTLDEYNDISISQIKQTRADLNIISSEKITFDDNPAYKIVYTGKQGQYSLKWMQIFTVINNSAYILTYTAEIKQYDSYLVTMTPIVESFKFVN